MRGVSKDGLRALSRSSFEAHPRGLAPPATTAKPLRRDDGLQFGAHLMSVKIKRSVYADMFGPTTGDRVRLADTDLIIEVEKDFTVYGEEVKFGGGKVIRDGMGQSQVTNRQGAADTVITNALIVDHWGIVKADVGLKGGHIWCIGKAGNPDVQPGVTVPIGGGTGPAAGTSATTCTPGPWHIHSMLLAAEGFAMNLGFLGKGNVSLPDAAREQIHAGAIGLKLHEDWGTTPAAIDNCLKVADELDVQVAIHTDTLNESGFLEATVAAIDGRTIHTFHTEGAGG